MSYSRGGGRALNIGFKLHCNKPLACPWIWGLAFGVWDLGFCSSFVFALRLAAPTDTRPVELSQRHKVHQVQLLMKALEAFHSIRHAQNMLRELFTQSFLLVISAPTSATPVGDCIFIRV
jgi:hypothetical protein